MISGETQIRVRYSEVDQMGYVYYGHYAQYYEVARAELLRQLDFSYRQLEEMGIQMPVIDLSIKYSRPARYDDNLTVKIYISEMPKVRIVFNYEVYNEEQELLNRGETTLVFINANTKKPCPIPAFLAEKMQGYFS